MEDLESEVGSWLELLPIEVITVIASHLNARDILKCCATSSAMRGMFSDNSIWRPLCDKELAENLKKTPGKVAPTFVYPQTENSSLSLLPDWRISYMRENHLWNNWRNGKFEKEYIKDKNSSADFHIFYNNDCVIARYQDRIEFLDVKVFPATDLVESVYFGTKHSNDLKIEIANDLIVFMVGSGVQVLELDLNMKKCNLKHTFFFENSLKSTISETHEVQSIFNVTKSKFKGKRLISGNFFVGVLEGESTMHIWNLETGQKLKKEAWLLKHSPVLEIQASDTMHVVLTVGKAIQKTKTFLVYSLVELKFLSFKETQVEINSSYCVHKDFIVIRFQKVVQVFNYQTSKLVATMPTDSFPRAIKNSLLFVKDNDIKVFNLILNTTESLSLNYVGLSGFEVLGNKFLQMNTSYDFHEHKHVWEIGETCQDLKLIKMYFTFHACAFFLNKACTRYIVREGIGYILNFW